MKERIKLGLLLTFVVIWAALAINPSYRQDWVLENALVLLAVPMLVAGYRRMPFSLLSCVMLFTFFCLHEIGAHYTYSEVPYDQWWQYLTGYSLNAALGWQRNHFDRLLHLLFGLLITYPMREMLVRLAGLRGTWSYLLPLAAVMALSLLYELVEWAAAVVFGGDLGMAYVGTQGDVWDAQKDMACAALAAITVMLLAALIPGDADSALISDRSVSGA
jgi:putative membrane protein